MTGAGKGIGRATALAFARAGADVIALSRTEDDLSALRAAAGNHALRTFRGDVSDDRQIHSVGDSNLTRVSVLVNNAAVLTAKSSIQKVSTEDWDLSFAVNVRGAFLMMKAVLPGMLERRSGLIINVSSGAGRRPAPGWGPYAVSKGALEALTAQAAAELNGTGVAVVSVDPGGTRTRMRAAAYPAEDPNVLPTPEETAAFLLDIACRPDWAALNGEALSFREWKSARR
ncbi:MAG: SDR family oxidoreductase [Elusimicrobia bacterium]|nr:SDR family oxidoreductase [Elusimicrobiota bacterium]